MSNDSPRDGAPAPVPAAEQLQNQIDNWLLQFSELRDDSLAVKEARKLFKRINPFLDEVAAALPSHEALKQFVVEWGVSSRLETQHLLDDLIQRFIPDWHREASHAPSPPTGVLK